MQKNDMEKTITFSIHEEDRDRERRQLLRVFYLRGPMGRTRIMRNFTYIYRIIRM